MPASELAFNSWLARIVKGVSKKHLEEQINCGSEGDVKGSEGAWPSSKHLKRAPDEIVIRKFIKEITGSSFIWPGLDTKHPESVGAGRGIIPPGKPAVISGE